MGSRVLGLLVTRAVLLTALCGLALSIAGSMSVHRQQYFDAWTCGDQVWDVSLEGSQNVWAAAETALAEHGLTLMASGPDPTLHHVTGPAAACLTGVDGPSIDSLRATAGFLVREGDALALRVQRAGVLGGRNAVVVPATQWPGLPHDSVIQPSPVSGGSPSYVGFLVGAPGDLAAAGRALDEAGVAVTAAPASQPLRAAASTPVLGIMSALTALTALSVTAFWALSLRSQEHSRLRVLRLLGVPAAHAALSRWPASVVPFTGAAIMATTLWVAVKGTGGLGMLTLPETLGVIGAVVTVDVVAATLTHVGVLWMRRVPR